MLKIPFAKVDCSGNERKYIEEVLESGWLTTASKTAAFEQKFKSFLGVNHALAVNSCTSALHLALEALDIGPGDKVVIPTLTFTSTAEVVRYLGADPVFVDVDYKTLLVSPEKLRTAFVDNSDIKACIVVHFGGQSVELVNGSDAGILDVCRDHNIRLIQDCAHAFPASDTYGQVGSIGDVSCFSFYANKTITTGEGGMLVTNDEAIAQRVKVMRLHGIDRDVWDRFTSNAPSWEYDVVAPGFKYNMPDINAAIGLAQFERCESMRVERQRCAEFYIANLSDCTSIDIVDRRVDNEQHAWHLFPIVINPEFKSRQVIFEKLSEDGIGISVHYKPLHRMTYYRDKYGLTPDDFPEAERYWSGCLSLPIYASLNETQLSYVVERLLFHLS